MSTQELVGKKIDVRHQLHHNIAGVEAFHIVQIDHYVIVTMSHLVIYRQGKVEKMVELQHPLTETALLDDKLVGICLDTTTIRMYNTSTLEQVGSIVYGMILEPTNESNHVKLMVFKKTKAIGIVRLETIKNSALLFDKDGLMRKFECKHGVPLKYDQEGQLVSFHQRSEDAIELRPFFGRTYIEVKNPLKRECTVMHVQMVDDKHILIGCNIIRMKNHKGYESAWFLVDRDTLQVSNIQYRIKTILNVLDIDTDRQWVILTQCNIGRRPTHNLVILNYFGGVVSDTPLKIREKTGYYSGTVVNYDCKMDELHVQLIKILPKSSIYVGLLHRLQLHKTYGKNIIHECLNLLNQQFL